MAEDLARKANEAFLDEDFEQAVELYSQAIRLDSSNATYFANRAQANIKLENFTDAVADANRAIQLDPSMSKAYLRKGIACFSLEEYQTAKAAFKAGSTLDSSNLNFNSWIEKCDARLAEEAAADVIGAVSVSPSNAVPVTTSLPLEATAPAKADTQQMTFAENAVEKLQQAKPKYRHEFYQSANEVVVTIFAKGLSKENVTIGFGEQFLSIVIQVPGVDEYALQNRLFAKIVPERSRYSILSTKIEIRLAKAETINWTSLEYDKNQTVPQKAYVASDSKLRINGTGHALGFEMIPHCGTPVSSSTASTERMKSFCSELQRR
ncbi:hypothetical protein KI387_037681 [Taxus chinensis]|uniref:Protein SGT1 homolog n=1 Tax=Taxus chinensis TaxID=29808 RepID=A0AA38L6H5_TAXCH|nr:hypothetical protein KI387_037681 [Taxus chinensis]